MSRLVTSTIGISLAADKEPGFGSQYGARWGQAIPVISLQPCKRLTLLLLGLEFPRGYGGIPTQPGKKWDSNLVRIIVNIVST